MILYCQRAFDAVPHRRLVKNLNFLIGIRGRFRWIENCRSGRERRHIGGALSRWVDITSGVLQGWVLGQLLFFIKENDLSGLFLYLMKFSLVDEIQPKRMQNNEGGTQ